MSSSASKIIKFHSRRAPNQAVKYWKAAKTTGWKVVLILGLSYVFHLNAHHIEYISSRLFSASSFYSYAAATVLFIGLYLTIKKAGGIKNSRRKALSWLRHKYACSLARCLFIRLCCIFKKTGAIKNLRRKPLFWIRNKFVSGFYGCSSAFLFGGIVMTVQSGVPASKDWFACAIMAAIIGYIFSIEMSRSAINIVRNAKLDPLH